MKQNKRWARASEQDTTAVDRLGAVSLVRHWRATGACGGRADGKRVEAMPLTLGSPVDAPRGGLNLDPP